MSLNTTKPTAYTTSGGTTPLNPTSAYDGAVNDTTTACTVAASQPASVGTKTSVLVVKTFTAMSAQAYQSKTLKINRSVDSINDAGGNNPIFKLEFSINSGSSWSLIESDNNVFGEATVNQTLLATQDETLVQVRATTSCFSDGSALAALSASVYDVWIEGVYGVAGAGKKAVGLAC